MPYWRLSGFYFFYFATLGVLVPYWGLYLQSVGFTPVDIGNLIAILMFSRIVAPMVWGWIADHRESRMAVVRLASFLTIVAFSGAFFGSSFWWLAVVMLLFSFFWHASLPLLGRQQGTEADLGLAGGQVDDRMAGDVDPPVLIGVREQRPGEEPDDHERNRGNRRQDAGGVAHAFRRHGVALGIRRRVSQDWN
jgi:MFS family permease